MRIELIEETLNKPFYSIADKKPLLVEYQRLFGIELCDTCSGSYAKAYNELKVYYKNKAMAKRKETATEYEFKPEYKGSKVYVSGIWQEITEPLLTQQIVEEHFLPNEDLAKMIQVKNAD